MWLSTNNIWLEILYSILHSVACSAKHVGESLSSFHLWFHSEQHCHDKPEMEHLLRVGELHFNKEIDLILSTQGVHLQERKNKNKS